MATEERTVDLSNTNLSLKEEFDSIKKQVQKLLEDVEKLQNRLPNMISATERHVTHTGVLPEDTPGMNPVSNVNNNIELIDLTEDDIPQTNPLNSIQSILEVPSEPAIPTVSDMSKALPKPIIDIDESNKPETRIILSWNSSQQTNVADIVGFEIFAFCENNAEPNSSGMWRKIGYVGLMQEPTYTIFPKVKDSSMCYFVVRAVCKDGSYGHFSDPVSIMLQANN